MVASTINPARRAMETFYVWMAALFVLIAFSGFAETYWLQLPAGTFTGSPLLHLHGLLLAFAIVPISSAVEFAVLMTWAVVAVKDGETHKRLMMLNTMQILQAPIGRFFFLTVGGGAIGPGSRPGNGPAPPVATTVGAGVVVGLLILAAVIYDWRKRGKPHPVYVVGGIAVMAIIFLRVPLAETPQWQAMAHALDGFASYR